MPTARPTEELLEQSDNKTTRLFTTLHSSQANATTTTNATITTTQQTTL
jgi:hypothetical protein